MPDQVTRDVIDRPTGTPPLQDGEPALIMISGDLRPRCIGAFLHDVGLAVGHAFRQPGYLGGLGIQSSR